MKYIIKYENYSDIDLDPNFITKLKHESWGSSILIKDKSGKASGRMYWYNDDPETFYLCGLKVDPSVRKTGVGTMLQEIREKMAAKHGAKTIFLWVLKNSWMHNWYQRRGYEDYMDHEKQKNMIWMQKQL